MKTKMLYDTLLRMCAHSRSSWALKDKSIIKMFDEADSCAALYDKVTAELFKSIPLARGFVYGSRDSWKIRQNNTNLMRVYLSLISEDSVVPVEVKFDACASHVRPRSDAIYAWEEFNQIARGELRRRKKSPMFKKFQLMLMYNSDLWPYERARFNEFITCCQRNKPIMSTGYFTLSAHEDSEVLMDIVDDLIKRLGGNPFINIDEDK